MKEIQYYHGASRNGFLELAKTFGGLTDEPVEVVENTMLFPPSIATGGIEFYELSEGLAMGIADCTFHIRLKMTDLVVPGSDIYKIIYSISGQSLQVDYNNGEQVQLGNNMAESVFFTTHSLASTASFEKGQQVKLIIIYLQQAWGMHLLAQQALPVSVDRLIKLANHQSLQFASSLDLRSLDIIGKIMSLKTSPLIKPRILESRAYQLIALFCNNLAMEERSEKRIMSDDTIRVTQLKERLEKVLDEPLLSLNEAAAFCLMSRTKFLGMFRRLFGKNYAAYFLDLKMERAKELLEQGVPVIEVIHKVGYINISHFIKTFRLRYDITPGAYQKRAAGLCQK